MRFITIISTERSAGIHGLSPAYRFCLSTLIVVLLLGNIKNGSANGETPQSPSEPNVPTAASVAIPGTSVRLSPPDGFIPSERFSGFMNASTGSSIMVTDIPGSYAEAIGGLQDKRKLQARGVTLLERSSVKVDGQQALLINGEQIAYGMLFRKWMLAVDRSDRTTLIVATFPKVKVAQGEALKAAILAVTFGPPSDPVDALAFVATPIAPFQVATVMGQNMILSPNGDMPVKDERVPFMILGLSASEDWTITDQRTFAERRVRQTDTVKNITVEETTPITIGPLSGYATTARGVGEKLATPLTIYQILLFDKSGYSIIQGFTPTAEKKTYVPVFEQIAKTFKMKESHNESKKGPK